MLGLILTWSVNDEEALLRAAASLPDAERWTLRANLTALSLLPDREGMPKVSLERARVAALTAKLAQA